MIFVALSLVAVQAVSLAIFARVLSRRDRQHARERDLLVNQVLHLSGKPWQEAPAREKAAVAAVQPSGYDASRYVARPELLPN